VFVSPQIDISSGGIVPPTGKQIGGSVDPKRLTEWLGTAEGLGKALLAFVALPGSVLVGLTKELHPAFVFLRLPAWSEIASAYVISAAFLLLVLRSFLRFARASRVEEPDRFALQPTSPETLIGRTEDLRSLLQCVNNTRLVLLDGESGCGKSALVSTGLAELLKGAKGLLPLEMHDWGDDWVRGPLSAALAALFHALSQTDRDRLGWDSGPDLAANANALANELEARLKAVSDTLGRRPLLIADQFDDYQARHRDRFIDDNGNWLRPAGLAKANRFWKLVSSRLREGNLHLLVVTRSDTAAGFNCVRFMNDEETATRSLARVDAEYLRPLLRSIAPDDTQPAIVSRPESGWQDLRERLERDLKAEGAVLMQQVRTVLLGLRQLQLLTPTCYRAAGGLRGVETLFISRALRRAGDAAGGGEEGRRIARAVLGELILPGDANQPPKARRASFSDLCEVASDGPRAEAVLHALQREEVVRPAESAGGGNAWQLDHDYLARAVLAESRQTDRWSVVLREGKARYEEAAGDWRRRWSSLLPVSTLARVCWERALGHLRFADAANYARVSAIKPALVIVCLAITSAVTYLWHQDNLLTVEANRLIGQFGSSGENDAVLEVWRAPEPERMRIYKLVGSDHALLERATRTRWPMAHAGMEPARVREAATALRAEMEQAPDLANDAFYFQAYAAVAARLDDAADIRAAAEALRAQLAQARDRATAETVALAYATVVVRLNDAADMKAEAKALRAQLEQARDTDTVEAVALAYAAVAARLNDAADIKAAAEALRAQLEQARDTYTVDVEARA
jgi:hypothetical protein